MKSTDEIENKLSELRNELSFWVRELNVSKQVKDKKNWHYINTCAEVISELKGRITALKWTIQGEIPDSEPDNEDEFNDFINHYESLNDIKPLLLSAFYEKFNMAITEAQSEKLTYYLWLKRYKLIKFSK